MCSTSAARSRSRADLVVKGANVTIDGSLPFARHHPAPPHACHAGAAAPATSCCAACRIGPLRRPGGIPRLRGLQHRDDHVSSRDLATVRSTSPRIGDVTIQWSILGNGRKLEPLRQPDKYETTPCRSTTISTSTTVTQSALRTRRWRDLAIAGDHLRRAQQPVGNYQWYGRRSDLRHRELVTTTTHRLLPSASNTVYGKADRRVRERELQPQRLGSQQLGNRSNRVRRHRADDHDAVTAAPPCTRQAGARGTEIRAGRGRPGIIRPISLQ